MTHGSYVSQVGNATVTNCCRVAHSHGMALFPMLITFPQPQLRMHIHSNVTGECPCQAHIPKRPHCTWLS